MVDPVSGKIQPPTSKIGINENQSHRTQRESNQPLQNSSDTPTADSSASVNLSKTGRELSANTKLAHSTTKLLPPNDAGALTESIRHQIQLNSAQALQAHTQNLDSVAKKLLDI